MAILVIVYQKKPIFKHVLITASHIYAQLGEDAANREGWMVCIK